jgi:hypothetical protein
VGRPPRSFQLGQQDSRKLDAIDAFNVVQLNVDGRGCATGRTTSAGQPLKQTDASLAISRVRQAVALPARRRRTGIRHLRTMSTGQLLSAKYSFRAVGIFLGAVLATGMTTVTFRLPSGRRAPRIGDILTWRLNGVVPCCPRESGRPPTSRPTRIAPSQYPPHANCGGQSRPQYFSQTTQPGRRVRDRAVRAASSVIGARRRRGHGDQQDRLADLHATRARSILRTGPLPTRSGTYLSDRPHRNWAILSH